jgi:hypothetical protein
MGLAILAVAPSQRTNRRPIPLNEQADALAAMTVGNFTVDLLFSQSDGPNQ